MRTFLTFLFCTMLFTSAFATSDPYEEIREFSVNWIDPVKQDFPGGRGENELNVYTPAFGSSTGTNEWGIEAIIEDAEDGTIVRIADNDNAIPRKGFVISGNSDARKLIMYQIRLGQKVTLDRPAKKIFVKSNTATTIEGFRLEYKEIKRRFQEFKKLFSNSEASAVKRELKLVKEQIDLAQLLLNEKKYEPAHKMLEIIRPQIDQLWLIGSPSPTLECRGIWERILTDTPESVVAFLDQLQEHGFNMFFVETWYGGMSLYPSDIFPQHPQFKGWDPLALLIEEGHKRGIEIHAWVENMFVGQEDSPSVKAHPEWLMRTQDGKTVSEMEYNFCYYSWAIPEAKEKVRAYYREMIEKYPDLDGLHLDYIRWPLTVPGKQVFGYNPIARKAYQDYSGIDPIDIADSDTKAIHAWNIWQENLITDFVREVERETHEINPRITISAAVVPQIQEARKKKLQNWAAWLDEGLLDFICPMIYTFDSKVTYRDTRDMQAIAGDKAEVLPGIGTFILFQTSNVLRQFHEARRTEAPGFVIFCWQTTLPELLEDMKNGPLRNPAKPLPLRQEIK